MQGNGQAKSEPTPRKGDGATPAPRESVFDDLDAARYIPSENGPAGKKVLTFIAVKKPEPRWFIRTNPNVQFNALLYEDRDERETYYVAPTLEDVLERFGLPALLVLSITTQGTPFLWNLRLPGPYSGGNDLSRRWNDSARQAALLAEKQWISVRSNQQAGGYEALVAEKTHPEPEWPDLTLNEVLKLAFGDRLILDVDHPVLRKLRGG
jgi:hypothetical protein